MYRVSPVMWYIITIIFSGALVPPSLNDVPCRTPVWGVPRPLKVHWSGQPPVGRWMVSRMSQHRRADSR